MPNFKISEKYIVAKYSKCAYCTVFVTSYTAINWNLLEMSLKLCLYIASEGLFCPCAAHHTEAGVPGKLSVTALAKSALSSCGSTAVHTEGAAV